MPISACFRVGVDCLQCETMFVNADQRLALNALDPVDDDEDDDDDEKDEEEDDDEEEEYEWALYAVADGSDDVTPAGREALSRSHCVP